MQPGPGGRAARGHRRDRPRRGRRAAVGQLLSEPDPLRRPSQLRAARRVLRRSRAHRRRRSQSPLAPGASRGRRAGRSPAPCGSLEIESFEPEFEFDADGAVVGAQSVPQTEAHRLIEHLMILTNERVAQLLERRRVPTLYRVHEQPDPQRIERLVEQLAALGRADAPAARAPVSDPGRRADRARSAALVAREAARRGHGRDAYTSLVLRSLKQAYYSDRNLGHAGLGSSAVRSLHLADPSLSGPGRAPRAALGDRRGRGRAATRPGP